MLKLSEREGNFSEGMQRIRKDLKNSEKNPKKVVKNA